MGSTVMGYKQLTRLVGGDLATYVRVLGFILIFVGLIINTISSWDNP